MGHAENVNAVYEYSVSDATQWPEPLSVYFQNSLTHKWREIDNKVSIKLIGNQLATTLQMSHAVCVAICIAAETIQSVW
jgi:hypothetical protein